MAAGSANSFVMHAPRLFVQSARRLIFSLCETVNVIQRYLSLSSALQMLSKHYGLSGECPKATNDVLLKSRGSKCNIKYAPRWISESWGGKAHDPEQIVHCCLWVHIFRAAISICLFFFIFYLISSDLDNFKTQTVRSTVNVREGQGVVLLCGPPAHSGGNLLFGIILAFWSINPHIFFSSDRALWNAEWPPTPPPRVLKSHTPVLTNLLTKQFQSRFSWPGFVTPCSLAAASSFLE